jgi:hypothetical protein
MSISLYLHRNSIGPRSSRYFDSWAAALQAFCAPAVGGIMVCARTVCAVLAKSPSSSDPETGPLAELATIFAENVRRLWSELTAAKAQLSARLLNDEAPASAEKGPEADVVSPNAIGLVEASRKWALTKPSLADAVMDWQRNRPAATKGGGAAAQELHTKFAASSESFTYTYEGVEKFFEGLTGLIGPPSYEITGRSNGPMAREHASTEDFVAWNAETKRTTNPWDEWLFVTKGVAVKPEARDMDRSSGRLEDFANKPEVKKAGLLLAEVVGVRLYTCASQPPPPPPSPAAPFPSCRPHPHVKSSRVPLVLGRGPMYVHYNGVLRNKTKGSFVTTLHAINSGILKLSKQTKAATVYRGVAGGVLPKQFWSPNEDGVMGGIELGFMSTTTDRNVALGYMRQSNKAAKMLFEVRMGMIDRGAVSGAWSNARSQLRLLVI